MARIARKNLDAMYYHVMVQGINKEYIFEKDECKKIYIKLLKKYSSECDISLVAYCIMGNHAHLLLKIKNILDLSKCMKKINTTFAIYYNELLNRVGFVFRDRFKSEAIYDKYYLHNCIKYIHNNPMRKRDGGKISFLRKRDGPLWINLKFFKDTEEYLDKQDAF